MSFIIIRHHVFIQLVSALAAFLAILGAGFWMTCIAVALPKFKTGEIQIPWHDDQLMWMIVLFDIGSLIVPIPSGYLMDRYGRLFCVRLCSIFSLLASILAIYATSIYYLWAARFFAGMSKGIAYTVATVYVAEIAGKKIKGTLNGMFIFLFGIGGITAVGIGSIVSFETLNWISLIFPTLQFLLILFAVESPYYFFIHNNEEAAKKALRQLRDRSEINSTDKELEAIRKCVEEEMERPKSFSVLLTEKGVRKALLIVLMGSLLQRYGGTVIIATYATSTLPSDDFWNVKITHFLFTVISIFFSLLSLLLVDWCGRKPLLIISNVGTSVATGASAVFYFFYQLTHVDVTGFFFVPHVSTILFSIFYNIGVGPITHTLQGEMLPTRVKSQASAAFAMSQAICNFTLHKIYNIVDHQIGVYFMYLLSSISGIIYILFTIFVFIETKGKSLPEIQDELNGRKGSSLKNEETVNGQGSVEIVRSQP